MALNNVPLTGQSLGVTRVPINQNFSVIDTAFSVDHVSYNTSGQGKHNQVTLPVQAGAPTFATGDNGIYNLALSGVNEIYLHKQSAAGTKEIPMTASILDTVANPAAYSGGYTWLPSGIFLNWGRPTSLGGIVTVTMANPPPNGIINVLVSPFSATGGVTQITQVSLQNIISNSQFSVNLGVNGAVATATFTYLVIGY
jgi:hypothetical protein